MADDAERINNLELRVQELENQLRDRDQDRQRTAGEAYPSAPCVQPGTVCVIPPPGPVCVIPPPGPVCVIPQCMIIIAIPIAWWDKGRWPDAVGRFSNLGGEPPEQGQPSA